MTALAAASLPAGTFSTSTPYSPANPQADTVRMGVCKARESIIQANDGIQGEKRVPL